MTQFETIATKLIGKVETDDDGQYTGMTAGLAALANEAIFDKDLKNDEIAEYVEKRFYQLYPYMAK